MSWLDGIIDSMKKCLSKVQDIVRDRRPAVLQSLASRRVRHDRATEHQQQQQETLLVSN